MNTYKEENETLLFDRNITGTLIWYYYICHREVWLLSRQIEPSQENPFIELGRLISEESYKRERKDIRIGNLVIDILRKEDQQVIIGEVKKSSRYKKSALMQLAFYLQRIKDMGVDAKGELLFPKEKIRIEVSLTPDIEEELKNAEEEIKNIVMRKIPPEKKRIKFCSKCGYNEFCWA